MVLTNNQMCFILPVHIYILQRHLKETKQQTVFIYVGEVIGGLALRKVSILFLSAILCGMYL